MSFSTKSSREALADWVSLQANVTFKTISLLRTHDSERNTLSCSSMRATIRRFDCTTCCCPSVMQIDRCLCTTGTLRIDESSTTCGFYGEIARGNPKELHVAVVVRAIRRIGGSAAIRPAMLIRTVETPHAAAMAVVRAPAAAPWQHVVTGCRNNEQGRIMSDARHLGRPTHVPYKYAAVRRKDRAQTTA